MKKIVLGIAGAALLSAGALYAQQGAPGRGDALQASLKERALRIKKSERGAALRAAGEARAEPAQTMPREANWAAVREELTVTAAADQARNQDLAGVRAVTAPRIQTPPAGLRALPAVQIERADPEEVARVALPVLIPAHPDIRNNASVYGLANAYMATAAIDANANFSIAGTCNRVVGGDPNVVKFRQALAEKSPRLPGTGAAYQISRNDFGVDLSFSKFGCGYVISIECDDPAADSRCAGDDYVIGLADSLILANPERAGG